MGGLDVRAQTTSICIINGTGEICYEGTCPTLTKAVRHELATFRRSRFEGVFLEAGPRLHLARGLKSLGYPVQLYETRKLSKFLRARRAKTDAGDANGIAEAGRIGASIVPKVYLKDLENHCLQARLCIRRHLIKQRVAAGIPDWQAPGAVRSRLSPTMAKGQLRRVLQSEIR